MNGKPHRRITESPTGAPECIGNHKTINSFVKNLQLKNISKVVNAIQGQIPQQQVRHVYKEDHL